MLMALYICLVFFLAVLGLTAALSSGGARASYIAVTSYWWSTALGREGSVVVAHMGSVAPWYVASSPDRGRNPRPLHWRADSQPSGPPGKSATAFLQSPISSSKTQRSRLSPAFPEDRGRWLEHRGWLPSPGLPEPFLFGTPSHGVFLAAFPGPPPSQPQK